MGQGYILKNFEEHFQRENLEVFFFGAEKPYSVLWGFS